MRRYVAAVLLAVGAVFAAVPLSGTSWAASPTYSWSVDGLSELAGAPAPAGPNVSSTRDGKRIEIVGTGQLSPDDRWIDGGGRYRILGPTGTVLEAGRWKATDLRGFRDLGTEPEGSPVQELRAGVVVARVELQGIGSGRLVLYCGVHRDAEEIEGVDVRLGGTSFDRIETGSTTLVRS